MTAAEIIAALELPPQARVDRRIPKTLLVENGAPTAADKRQINEGLEELLWLAALKPSNIGIPEYRDAIREVTEIAVLSLAMRPAAKGPRLIELIARFPIRSCWSRRRPKLLVFRWPASAFPKTKPARSYSTKRS